MNGLCAGLGAIAAWYFAVIAAADGQYLVALIAFLTFGSLLGFLPYNFPRARAFLGAAGSHLVVYPNPFRAPGRPAIRCVESRRFTDPPSPHRKGKGPG